MDKAIFNPWSIRNERLVIGGLVLVLGVLFPVVTPYMWAASVSYAFMIAGLSIRKASPRAHAGFMSSTMAMDLLLVLILELKKDAVATALGFHLNLWQQAHIATSSMALVLYFPLAALGIYSFFRAPASTSIRRWHKRLGITAFIFRTLGFLLMFSMLGR